MITLYTFGPHFGLPDPSPFVTKAEVLLKMAGVPYRTDTSGFGKAPKGKLPYIDDDGMIVADSTFIRLHLEQRHGIDFERGLSAAQKGAAWAVEKLCEEHLYWIVVKERWCDKENFDKGPRQYFDKAPALVRPLVIAMINRQVKRNLHGQGLGRHTDEELGVLAGKAVDAIAGVLGDKPWLMGDEPCGADAGVWSFMLSGLCPLFRSTVRDHIGRHNNLVAYAARGRERWFADTAEAVD